VTRGFVLGSMGRQVDALADEQRLTVFLAASKGVVSTAHLVGLFGWLPAEAQSQFVRIMLDYGGDVTVTEDGSILWVFPSFAAGKVAVTTSPDSAETATSPNTLVEHVPPFRFFDTPRWFLVTIMGLLVPLAWLPQAASMERLLPNPIEKLGTHEDLLSVGGSSRSSERGRCCC
jgi:hypothetical protein